MIRAALVIIGDEILSGRTEDKNLAYLAKWLGNLGINLSEVRVVLDNESDIIESVNSLRKKYDYVFTTGGIGPTHDDITTEIIANAFGVKTRIDDDALKKMQDYLAGKELTDIMIGESLFAEKLEKIQNKFSDVDIGSYPFSRDGKYGATLVIRSTNEKHLRTCEVLVEKMISSY